MKNKYIIAALLSIALTASIAEANSFKISHLGSDAGNISFLQYIDVDGDLTSLITNRFYKNRTFEFNPEKDGHFVFSVVGTGLRVGLESDSVKQVGNTFHLDDGAPVDRDFNDFNITLDEYDDAGNLIRYDKQNTPTPTPEPGTLALLGTGMVGLLCYRRKKS